MNCEELQDSYELYALHLLEEPERSELEAHLARHCPNCEPGVARAETFNAVLMASLPEVSPSSNLRARIQASVGGKPHPLAWWEHPVRWSPILAGLLLAFLWFSYNTQQHERDMAAAREENLRNSAELQRARAVLDLLNQPETRDVSFGQGTPNPPSGRVFVNPQRGVALIANHLPPVGQGQTYEMWLVPKAGAPRPAGLFQSGTNSVGINVYAGAVAGDVAAVAVSVEPAAGSPAPTTTPLFAAKFGP